MATHDQNIQNLRDAVKGEDVRGSMIELFIEDYDLSKIKFGSSDPTGTAFVDGTTYINKTTWDVFKRNGNTWTKVGNIKGQDGVSILANSSKTGKTTTVNFISASDGTVINTITVQDGADGTGAGDMTKSVYDTDNDGIVDRAEVADSVDWEDIENIPEDLGYITSVTENQFTVGSNKKLALHSKVIEKLSTLDELTEEGSVCRNLCDGKRSYLTSNDGTTIIYHQDITSVIIKIEPNTKYTLKKGTRGNRFSILYTDTYPNVGGVCFDLTVCTTNPFTTTSPSNAQYMIALLDYASEDGYLSTQELKVSKGDKAEPYTPYALNNAELTSTLSTLGTASVKDVPSSGNASANQVVLGNDSRLTNSRPASDVYSWAKASSKPTYSASEVGIIYTRVPTAEQLKTCNAALILFNNGTSYFSDVFITKEFGQYQITYDYNGTRAIVTITYNRTAGTLTFSNTMGVTTGAIYGAILFM